MDVQRKYLPTRELFYDAYSTMQLSAVIRDWLALHLA